MKTLFLTFLLPLQASACLWVDGTTLDGNHRSIGGFPATLLQKSLTDTPEDKFEKINQLRGRGQRDDFSQNEIDGVQEVIEGNYDRAIGIFERAEAAHPGRYSTAVNLGTAYELKGELEPALKWISEGIRRNPDSHLGTEWLHVEIIKTRMKLKENPDYLRQNHMIGLPDSYSGTTSILIGDGSHTVDEISDSILYQLEERMIFVKPPDPVVADLLFTFGEIEGRTNVVESGIKLLAMANAYGFANQKLIVRKIEEYERAIQYGKMKRNAYIVLPVMAFILFLIIAWRKRWFFLSRAAYLKHRVNKHLHPEA